MRELLKCIKKSKAHILRRESLTGDVSERKTDGKEKKEENGLTSTVDDWKGGSSYEYASDTVKWRQVFRT